MSSTFTTTRTHCVTVTLGVAFHAAYPSQCRQVDFPLTVPAEFSLDDLFTALNRIRDCQQADVDALEWDWQRIARRRLDLLQAPSMSVGDTVELFSSGGRSVGKFAVASRGWTAL